MGKTGRKGRGRSRYGGRGRGRNMVEVAQAVGEIPDEKANAGKDEGQSSTKEEESTVFTNTEGKANEVEKAGSQSTEMVGADFDKNKNCDETNKNCDETNKNQDELQSQPSAIETMPTPLADYTPVVLDDTKNERTDEYNDKKQAKEAGSAGKEERDPHPFHLLRKGVSDFGEKSLTKTLKKHRKELKHSGAKKKVRKSLGGFLGDKEKYDINEMIADVKIGLKPNQQEQQFCSLGSFLQPQPYRGKAILPLSVSQLSGFRLHHGPALHLMSPSARAKMEAENKIEPIKIPLVSASGKRRGRIASTD